MTDSKGQSQMNRTLIHRNLYVRERWVESRHVEEVASQMEGYLKVEEAQTYRGMQACGCIHDDLQS